MLITKNTNVSNSGYNLMSAYSLLSDSKHWLYVLLFNLSQVEWSKEYYLRFTNEHTGLTTFRRALRVTQVVRWGATPRFRVRPHVLRSWLSYRNNYAASRRWKRPSRLSDSHPEHLRYQRDAAALWSAVFLTTATKVSPSLHGATACVTRWRQRFCLSAEHPLVPAVTGTAGASPPLPFSLPTSVCLHRVLWVAALRPLPISWRKGHCTKTGYHGSCSQWPQWIGGPQK